MLRKKLMLIGGGGHCRSVLDSVISADIYEEIGIVDSIDDQFPGVPVIGTDDDIPRLIRNGWTDAFVTVGSVRNTSTRRRLYEMIRQYGLRVPVIIDPTAVVGNDVEIEEGVFVGKRAVINAGASVGVCAIINTGAIIEHNCSIGAFSHISPGVTLCGQVSIGADAHIGAGSVIRQGITVGKNALIGVGSVVVKIIPDGAEAYGNPCRVV